MSTFLGTPGISISKASEQYNVDCMRGESYTKTVSMTRVTLPIFSHSFYVRKKTTTSKYKIGRTLNFSTNTLYVTNGSVVVLETALLHVKARITKLRGV